MTSKFSSEPHIRYNPLRGDWILVSPHRTLRPWSGQVEKSVAKVIPESDPLNPLCPGSLRNGKANPMYQSTYTFDNDFPALKEETTVKEEKKEEEGNELFQAMPVTGKCRVMCFHPKLNVTLANMKKEEIIAVIDSWKEETRNLGSKFNWVQVFENKGEVMGCSNPHPHSQIWASSFLPNEARIEHEKQKQFLDSKKQVLLFKYAQDEMKHHEIKNQESRVVHFNTHWIVVVPYWATWPYETLLLPRFKIERLTEVEGAAKDNLAAIINQLMISYDNLFQTSFPYSMGWHGAPTGEMAKDDMSHWQLHAHYYPPLLRSATIRKFMVGYELLAQAQRDLTPEQAAEKLRSQPREHYTSLEQK